LKVNALKAAFNVATRVDQKLIKKNDVKPISSQPKKRTTKLPLETNKTMLITNKLMSNIKRSTFGSERK
jgi:hypothetical protein